MLKIASWTLACITAVALAACQSAPPTMTQIPAKITNGAVADPSGKTLYTFAKDVAGSGKSECNGPCANAWPPFSAEGGASPAGNWTIITREDGMRQWAYKGKPLYTYAKDAKPGDRSGDNINGLWSWAKE
jgi:predicted lipoprotein with Yx(FWY)xxD motif